MINKIQYIIPNLIFIYHFLFSFTKSYKSNSIKGIIFSKDRPIQLDALLRSYYLYCERPTSLVVIYNTSNDKFQKAYNELELIYPKANFIKEINFRNDLINELNKVKEQYIFFAVDDMVFIRKFSFTDIIRNMKSRSIFSMRLGRKISWCETCQIEMSPVYNLHKNLLKWEWSKNNYDWGYRFSVDGNVFKTNEILALTRSLKFKGPNSYEGLMNGFFLFKYKKWGFSFKEPIVTNLVLNKIQTESEYDNLFGDISVDNLLEYWNEGLQFDLNKISEYNFNSVHKILFEIPLMQRLNK